MITVNAAQYLVLFVINNSEGTTLIVHSFRLESSYQIEKGFFFVHSSVTIGLLNHENDDYVILTTDIRIRTQLTHLTITHTHKAQIPSIEKVPKNTENKLCREAKEKKRTKWLRHLQTEAVFPGG